MTPFKLGLRQFPEPVQAGETLYVTGAAAAGKTFVLSNIMRAAVKAGNKVGLLSLDFSDQNVWMVEARQECGEKLVMVNVGTTMDALAANIDSAFAKCDVVCVDNLYLLASAIRTGHGSATEAMTNLSRRLEGEATKKGAALMAATQVNRNSDQYKNPPSTDGLDCYEWNHVRCYLVPLARQSIDTHNVRRTYIVRGGLPGLTHADSPESVPATGGAPSLPCVASPKSVVLS